MSKILFLLVLPFLFHAQKKDVITVNCDSVYNHKGYIINLESDPDVTIFDENNSNTIFTFSKHLNGKQNIIYREKIFSQHKNIEFKDFNGDGIKDILVGNISDVRSNLTYNLFIFDIRNQKLKKIEGFNEIKNPNYLKEYDLIDCLVMSGNNWTGFYKIKGNTIKDFGYVIEAGEDDNGIDLEYETNYQKTLAKILKSENKTK